MRFTPNPGKPGWLGVYVGEDRIGDLLATKTGHNFYPKGGGVFLDIPSLQDFFTNYHHPQQHLKKLAPKRPRKGQSFRQLNVAIPEHLFLDFRFHCAERGLSMTGLVEQAIKGFLDDSPRDSGTVPGGV
jgi:hypothetical protein